MNCILVTRKWASEGIINASQRTPEIVLFNATWLLKALSTFIRSNILQHIVLHLRVHATIMKEFANVATREEDHGTIAVTVKRMEVVSTNGLF